VESRELEKRENGLVTKGKKDSTLPDKVMVRGGGRYKRLKLKASGEVLDIRQKEWKEGALTQKRELLNI